ncbi:MAG TPA: hypothetical protein VKS01_06705 [Bryobacteraceae bacterium]|nr:hypothetical protein [Bryobacteraceae bacterium]
MGVFGRFLFWDYKRASWQYDVMVGVILLFIFLTPRDIFRDQPTPVASVVMLHGGFWIAPQLLNGVPQDQLLDKARALVKSRYNRGASISSVEPINGESGDEVTGYMAFTK